MGRIYITRHGETEWNIIRKMQGHRDSPLTELGIKQANWLSERLHDINIDYIYSSPLKRALDTASIIKGNRDIDIIPADELKEIYLGSWEGNLVDDIEKEYPSIHYNFWNEPHLYEPIDGETFSDLSSRVGMFFDNLKEKHIEDDVLIVAHAVVLKSLLNYITYKDISKLWNGPHIKPTCLSILNNENGNIKIELIGDVSHYKEVNTTGGWFIDD